MSSIISTLSGNFGKSIILGTMLPVTVFVIAAWQFLQPFARKINLKIFELTNVQAVQSELLALSLVIVLVSAILYFLNTSIIRIYEGYPWKDTWLGRFLTGIQTRRYRHTTSRAKGYRILIHSLEKSNAKLSSRWSDYMQDQRVEFFIPPGKILPTRLGNIIRSFEHYPRHQYGIDAVSFWPRLVAVIDKDFSAALDDAKISFDFMVNASFLAVTLTILLLINGTLFPAPLSCPRVLLSWGAQLVICASIAWIFYLFSLRKAVAWGDLVKSTFDLYRFKMLAQLGYNQKPVGQEEERILWRTIANQLVYGDSPTGPYPPYTWGSPATYAIGTPVLARLEFTRGLNSMRGNRLKVELRVKNVDLGGRKVENIWVSDQVPENYVYQWGSARIRGKKASPLGTDPLRFEVASLEPGAEISISYCLLKL